MSGGPPFTVASLGAGLEEGARALLVSALPTDPPALSETVMRAEALELIERELLHVAGLARCSCHASGTALDASPRSLRAAAALALVALCDPRARGPAAIDSASAALAFVEAPTLEQLEREDAAAVRAARPTLHDAGHVMRGWTAAMRERRRNRTREAEARAALVASLGASSAAEATRLAAMADRLDPPSVRSLVEAGEVLLTLARGGLATADDRAIFSRLLERAAHDVRRVLPATTREGPDGADDASDRLDAAAAEFDAGGWVMPTDLERAYNGPHGRTKATAIASMLRGRRKLALESAREAKARGDKAAPAKGWRRKPAK